MRGTMKTMYAPMGVAKMTKDMVRRGIEWHKNLGSVDKEIQERSSFIVEALLFVCC